MDLTYGWASITKSHPLPDGSVIVEGRLGGPTEDLDGEYLDKDWLDVAVPKWAQRGNIRAMHQPISAGTAMATTDMGEDWFLQAKINDPVEARKCLDGNYTGFSVGVKNGGVLVTSKMAKNGQPLKAINKGDIVEVSLADFPCDPRNTLSLVDKAAKITDADIEVVAKAVDPEPVAEPKADMTLSELVAKLASGQLSEANVDGLTAIKAIIDQALGTVKTAPVEPVVDPDPKVDPVIEPKSEPVTKAVTPDITDLTKVVSVEVAKAVTSDLLKAAVESAIKPLSDRIAEMETRAAPGGPNVGSMRQLSGSESHQKNLLARRTDELTQLLEHPNPTVASGARDLLTKLAS